MANKKQVVIAEMQAVESSNVESIGYDSKSKTMAVKFIGGGTYHCSPITAKQFADFQAAESKGKWYHQNVKSNRKVLVLKQEEK